MNKFKIKYWKEGTFWIGYLLSKPEQIVKADTLAQLQEKLRDIYFSISIPLTYRKK